MKNLRTTLGLTLAILTLLAAPVFAGTKLGRSNLEPGQTSDPRLFDINAVTITQSATASIVSFNSASCNNGFGHAPNSYLRRFKLATDHGILTAFTVQSVAYGVEEASSGDALGQPLNVNLYTIPTAAAFTFANMTAIGTAAEVIPDQMLTAHITTVAGVVASPTTQDLVVELFTPDGRTQGNLLWIGSNADGQTRPSFIAAAVCGLANPTDVAAINFPDMHIVMGVTGSENPTGVANQTWGRLKTLYR